MPLPRWPSAFAKLAEPIAVRVRAAPGWTIAPLPGAVQKIKASGSPEEWMLTVEPEQGGIAKFSAKPLPKQNIPPPRAVATSPPQAVPGNPSDPAAADTPPSPSVEMRPSTFSVRVAIWLGAGLILSLLLLRGSPRWRPEALALLAILAITALGATSTLAIPFWCLAGWAILMRSLRSTRRLLRAAFA